MVAFGRYAVPVPSGDVFQPVNVYPVRLNPTLGIVALCPIAPWIDSMKPEVSPFPEKEMVESVTVICLEKL